MSPVLGIMYRCPQPWLVLGIMYRCPQPWLVLGIMYRCPQPWLVLGIMYRCPQPWLVLGIMYRCSKLLEYCSVYMLYSTLFLPYLLYCVEIWGNTYSTNLECIIMLQKRVIQLMHNAQRYDHTTPQLYLAWMHACMHVCMNVCICVCMYVNVHTYNVLIV